MPEPQRKTNQDVLRGTLPYFPLLRTKLFPRTGRLSPSPRRAWSIWFEGLAVLPGPGDETLLYGLIQNQAALHGVLLKVRDLSLTLISVKREER
jgi:hypothetical protein